jgi:energy-coupling factor transport system permease protein
MIAQGKQSFLHNLDPRTKICFVISMMSIAMLFFRLDILLYLLITLLIIVFVAQIFKTWLNTLKGIFYFIILIFIVNTLVYGYSKSPKPLNLLELESWTEIFLHGSKYGGLLALRLVIFSGVTILFILTTDLEDLGIALRKMKFPYELVFILVATVRFVPVLIDDIETIIKAHMVKGIEFQRVGFLTKIKLYAGLLIPLIIVSLRRSYRLAEAMDARGFGAEKKRTFYTDVNMRTRDWILSCIFIAILAIGILNRLSIIRMLI